jgi:thiopeptide-type bacteriocin biosynthesis protein
VTTITSAPAAIPSTATAIPSAVGDARCAGTWQAIHVYYGASRRVMLTDCIGPLIDGLRADGLLDSYFFINYWLEGPHLRLRLKPTRAADTDAVLRRAEDAIDVFLRARPALFDPRRSFFSELYDTLFDLEFTAEQRQRYTGPDGRMRIRESNSHSREPYEPEYGKYGGPRGIELAEWHFEYSSDHVISIMRTMNAHLRGALLGIAAQLMMVTITQFLPDPVAAASFLDGYHEFWRRAFDVTSFIKEDAHERAYETGGPGLRRRFAVVRAALATGSGRQLPEFLGGWAAHCAQLHSRAAALAESGQLVLRSWDDTRDETVTDPAMAARRLLSPYLHMTNNRLGATVSDEAYLAYALARALREGDS